MASFWDRIRGFFNPTPPPTNRPSPRQNIAREQRNRHIEVYQNNPFRETPGIKGDFWREVWRKGVGYRSDHVQREFADNFPRYRDLWNDAVDNGTPGSISRMMAWSDLADELSTYGLDIWGRPNDFDANFWSDFRAAYDQGSLGL